LINQLAGVKVHSSAGMFTVYNVLRSFYYRSCSPRQSDIMCKQRRHTSQGAQTRAKPSFLGQKLNFSGSSQQQKMKKTIFLCIY